MVIKEFYRTREDGVGLYKSYSDKGVYIRKIGTSEEYSEAIDVEYSLYVYEETDKPIEKEEIQTAEKE
jgi:hypothetical protein